VVHTCHAADECVAPDAGVLVRGRQPAHDHMISKAYMPAQSGVVGHENMIPDDAVMSHVDANHEEAVRTHRGYAPAHGRSAVHRHVLPDQVSRPDDESGWLPFVTRVLRGAAQDSKRVHRAAGPDLRGALDDNVRADPHTLA
jgi:hypothetical protein